MSELFVPASLTSAKVASHLLEQLEKLGDPNTMKKIKEEIVSAHALNETEAAKAAEARSVISKNQSILDEIIRISKENEDARKKMIEDKAQFQSDMEEERERIAIAKKDAAKELEKALQMQSSAENVKNSYLDKESALRINIETHNKNVAALKKNEDALNKKHDDADALKKKYEDMLEELRAKKEAMSKFNII